MHKSTNWSNCGLFVVLMALFFLVFATQAHAVAIGVNRASLDFSEVLRGGYAEAIVVVTTDSDEPIGGEVIISGEAAEWFNFSSREFNFSSKEPYSLRVSVQPPIDAQVQDYRVNLTVITGSIGRSDGGRMGTSTRASFRIPIRVGMTGNERLSCNAGGVRVLDTERGQPLEFMLSVLNRGNVRINPDVMVEIFDQNRARSLGSRTIDFGSRILPTVTGDSSRQVPLELPSGQYWAAIKVPMCEYSTLLTFDVLEPGEIKDDGDFIRIDSPSWANTGDIVPINAVFRNRGVRGVRATFKGTIARQDTQEIVKVISTDEYVVQPDATAEIPTFFNPQSGGQYIISGKIYYNNKLTVERNTIINVNGAPVGSSVISRTTLIIIIIGIIILILLILIKRRRRPAYG